jgi:tetratricopeptide (TPR) repeat protein
MDDLNKAIAIAPSCAYLYYNRANVSAADKDYRQAINDYTKAIDLDARLAEAYHNRGMALIDSGNTTEGIADLSKAGELGLYTAYSLIKKYRK